MNSRTLKDHEYDKKQRYIQNYNEDINKHKFMKSFIDSNQYSNIFLSESLYIFTKYTRVILNRVDSMNIYIKASSVNIFNIVDEIFINSI